MPSALVTAKSKLRHLLVLKSDELIVGSVKMRVSNCVSSFHCESPNNLDAMMMLMTNISNCCCLVTKSNNDPILHSGMANTRKKLEYALVAKSTFLYNLNEWSLFKIVEKNRVQIECGRSKTRGSSVDVWFTGADLDQLILKPGGHKLTGQI